MVIDLKYHLTTIIAIFLALAVGILIGTAMVGDDGVVKEQQALIAQIEDNLGLLRSQNSQFKTRLSALEDTLVVQNRFIDQLFQDAIAERLSGMRCLLVPDKTREKITELIDVFKAAGVNVTDFSTLPENWQVFDSKSTWDFCLLLGKDLPVSVNQIFKKDQIYQPSSKDLTSKESLYNLVKSIAGKINLEVSNNQNTRVFTSPTNIPVKVSNDLSKNPALTKEGN